MKVLDGPMNIELEGGELHTLVEAAIHGPSEAAKELLREICYHMVWDDLGEELDK